MAATVAPDVDVIYNAAFRGFVNHSLLWTHSIFTYLALGVVWLALWHSHRIPYARMLLGLWLVGGVSHLLLDVISHGTPLLYPLSLQLFGSPPTRVLEGGLAAYVTDPVFLFEPLLLALALGHWLVGRTQSPRKRRMVVVGLTSSVLVFEAAFLVALPTLQQLATPFLGGR